MDINSTFNDLMKNENFMLVRSMFYLLTPSETYFEKENDVPDLTAKAIPIFFAIMFVEQILMLIKNGKFNGRAEDMVTSVGAGIVHAFPNMIFREVHIVVYAYIYYNFKIIDLPWDSVWTYVISFLFIDMGYYWFHRAAHEVNLFWAAHQTHHSSEDYNLSTALRQSIFQKYTSWMFYLPLAFFVKPSIFMVHSHMNLLYQFWIHTELVDSIGPLEYILNTPSHHRVHHGRNPYCIDKNYAGVLIIWDRMFGTFEAEKKDEQIAYGLVHPINSFDPVYIQIFNYQYIIKKFFSATSLSERFSILFKGPGWVSGSGRLGNPGDIPPVSYPVKVYSNDISPILNFYIALNFAFVVTAFSEFVKDLESYPALSLSLFIFVLLYSLSCFGFYFDLKGYAILCDSIRCLILLYFCFQYRMEVTKLLVSSNALFEVFKYLNIISLFGLLTYSVTKSVTTNKSISKEDLHVRKRKRA